MSAEFTRKASAASTNEIPAEGAVKDYCGGIHSDTPIQSDVMSVCHSRSLEAEVVPRAERGAEQTDLDLCVDTVILTD